MIALVGSHQLFLVRDYCLKAVTLVFLFCCSLVGVFLWGHSTLVDLLDFNCEILKKYSVNLYWYFGT